MPRASSCFKPLTALIIALAALTGQSLTSSAASYARTSLQEMTQRAFAVAEVRVLSRSYPVSNDTDFQRTHVEVAIQKTLKGALPETLTLDLPGGLRGNQVFLVADSAEFQVGERAMVFIKEPTPGVYMVQDLGMGKFNIVERAGQTFVESALCPKAMETSTGTADANLLTKSIPYADFCSMISSYAVNEKSTVSPIKLALLSPSGSHFCDPSKPCIASIDAALNADAAKQTRAGLSLALCGLFMAACAATVVYMRRRSASKTAKVASIKSVALILSASLIAGAALGGSYSLAYVAAGPVWNLDDTNNPTKIQSGKVLWKQSTQGSKTNSACFAGVQNSFNQWSSIANCRLGFTNVGTTTNTVHSSSDNVNFVVWDPNPSSDFSSSTLGITYSVYTVGSVSNFIDCDIVFNDRDFNWAPGGTGNIGSVTLHEIGHFLGLAHTTDTTCVMFPIDRGFLQLSKDELVGAQTLYPSTSGTTPPVVPPTTPPVATPPIAALSGSPLSGAAPLNCGLDASASAAGSSPIASYSWNFGDGVTATGKTTGHSYSTPGIYSASVTVTDTKGQSNTATVMVNVAAAGTTLKGSFRLNFAAGGKDAFSATLLSTELANFSASTMVDGTVTVAGATFPFSYDSVHHKAYGQGGLTMTVNAKTGAIGISLKNVNLQGALAADGATNSNANGTTVTVPVSIVFGDGTQLALFNQIGFYYYAVAGKAGAGKF